MITKATEQTSLITKATNIASIEDTYDIIDKDEIVTTESFSANNNVSMPQGPVSANQPTGNVDVFHMIEIHKGNLLDHPVSLVLAHPVSYANDNEIFSTIG